MNKVIRKQQSLPPTDKSDKPQFFQIWNYKNIYCEVSMDIRYILEISPQEQISFSLADTQEDMKYYLSGLILVSAYTL